MGKPDNSANQFYAMFLHRAACTIAPLFRVVRVISGYNLGHFKKLNRISIAGLPTVNAARIALLDAASALLAAGVMTGALVARAQLAPHPTTAESLAAQIPTNVKQAILNSLQASNGPTADDKQGGFHEEGGIWVTTVNGGVVAEPAVPGKYAKPGRSANMQVNKPANALPPAASIAAVDGTWHVHPAGETVNRRVLPPKEEGDRKVITVITTTSYFGQPPSEGDIAAAKLPVNVVIGARSQLVYFYDRSGIIGTMPLEEFLAPLELPAAVASQPFSQRADIRPEVHMQAVRAVEQFERGRDKESAKNTERPKISHALQNAQSMWHPAAAANYLPERNFVQATRERSRRRTGLLW